MDIIIKDCHWGLRDLESAQCLTFVQVASVDRETLFSIVAGHFPVARKYLGYAAAVLTIRSAFRRAFAIHKKQQRHLRRGDAAALPGVYNDWHDFGGGQPPKQSEDGPGGIGAAPAGQADDGDKGLHAENTRTGQHRAAFVAARCIGTTTVAARRPPGLTRWLQRSDGDRVSAGWDAGWALTQASKRALRAEAAQSVPEPPLPLFERHGMRISMAGSASAALAATALHRGPGYANEAAAAGTAGSAFGLALNGRLASLESAMGQLQASHARVEQRLESRLEHLDDKLEAVLHALGDMNRRRGGSQGKDKDRSVTCSSQESFSEERSAACSGGGVRFGLPRSLCSSNSACLSDQVKERPAREATRSPTRGIARGRTRRPHAGRVVASSDAAQQPLQGAAPALPPAGATQEISSLTTAQGHVQATAGFIKV